MEHIYKTCFMIGRFQPFHLGHLHAVKYVLGRTDRLLIGLGSSNIPPSFDNPFSADERREMIRSSLTKEKERIEIYGIADHASDEKWVSGLLKTLPPFEMTYTNNSHIQYLFRERSMDISGIPFFDRSKLSGTGVRENIRNGLEWRHMVPAGTVNVVEGSKFIRGF